MCRLAYLPKQFVRNCPKRIIIQFFKKLETLNGGDGNGFLYLDSGRIEKDSTIPIETLYNNPHKEGLIFHTRRRSHGPINDFLCHPFETENYVSAHNGIWANYSAFENLLSIEEDVSDSYVMAQVIQQFGVDRFFQSYSRLGVVLIYDKTLKRTFCAYTSGDFEVLITKYGRIYASTFGDYHYGRNYDIFKFFNGIAKERIKKIPNGFYELASEGIYKIDLTKSEITIPEKQNNISNEMYYENAFTSEIKQYKDLFVSSRILNQIKHEVIEMKETSNLKIREIEDEILNNYNSIRLDHIETKVDAVMNYLKKNFNLSFMESKPTYDKSVQMSLNEFLISNINSAKEFSEASVEIEKSRDSLKNLNYNNKRSVLDEVLATPNHFRSEIFKKKHAPKREVI